MEKLWQKFERTGSIQAYLKYQSMKAAAAGRSKPEAKKARALAKAGR